MFLFSLDEWNMKHETWNPHQYSFIKVRVDQMVLSYLHGLFLLWHVHAAVTCIVYMLPGYSFVICTHLLALCLSLSLVLNRGNTPACNRSMLGIPKKIYSLYNPYRSAVIHQCLCTNNLLLTPGTYRALPTNFDQPKFLYLYLLWVSFSTTLRRRNKLFHHDRILDGPGMRYCSMWAAFERFVSTLVRCLS